MLNPPMTRPVNPPRRASVSEEKEKAMSEQKTLVVLTALDLEYESIRGKLTDIRVQSHRAGTRFEVGRLADRDCRVALALVGKGNHAAAVLAERAISEFDPAALLFVGVAGALRPSIALGDIVVATHVYAYHGGTSQDDGLKARPRVWECCTARSRSPSISSARANGRASCRPAWNARRSCSGRSRQARSSRIDDLG